MLLIVNAFNLVDVTDGLLVVVGCLAAIGLLGGSFLTSPLNRIECEVILATLVAAFWFNRPPARVYLGDAGALPLGFLLASLFLVGFTESSDTEGFAHLGAFAVPLFEVALIAPARIHAGLSPFLGSRDHFALRLHEQAGWSKERVLVTTVAFGAVLPRVVLRAVTRHPWPCRRRSRDRIDRRGGRRVSLLLAPCSTPTRPCRRRRSGSRMRGRSPAIGPGACPEPLDLCSKAEHPPRERQGDAPPAVGAVLAVVAVDARGVHHELAP